MTRSVTTLRRDRIALVLVALLGAACEERSALPLAPRTPPTPPPAPPAPPPVFGWLLTTTRTSLTGAEICGWDAPVGPSTVSSIDIRRSDSEIKIIYGGYPIDHLELVGPLDGEAFTASASSSSAMPCNGRPRGVVFESRVVGRFSPDGTALVARETLTYRFAPDEAIIYSSDWAATKRPGF